MTTDHDEIRRWAEERGGKPAAVRRTGRGKGDTGMIRIDFPGYSGAGSLEPITWERWFEKFDESNLALILQDETAGGQRSNFNKLISRESVDADGKVDKSRSRRARGRGDAATSRRAGAVKGAAKGARASRSASPPKASQSKAHVSRTRNSRGATKRGASTRTTRRATPGKRRAGTASSAT